MTVRVSREPLRAFPLPAAAQRLRIAEAQVRRLVEQGSLIGFLDDTDRLVVLLPLEPDPRASGWAQGFQTADSPGTRQASEERQNSDPDDKSVAAGASQVAENCIPPMSTLPTSAAPPWELLKEAFDSHCQLVERLLDRLVARDSAGAVGSPVTFYAASGEPAPAPDRDSRLLEELCQRVERLERSSALQEQDLDSLLEVTQLLRDHLDGASGRRGTIT